jgi:predicted CXXCH cytochrome family protein
LTFARRGAIAALLLLLAGVAVVTYTHRTRTVREGTAIPAATADYVGSERCRDCHAQEYTAWLTSDHQHAMQIASAGSVLGDFAGSHFSYAGVVTRFMRRNDGFVIRTDDADGRLRDFVAKYTFGVRPLQQYLIELPGGRLQALSIAWDTRPKAEGGQRWFHLYPRESVTHGDELHWTGRQQNWNFMCADCHSTNVRKGYDASADAFRTTWSEISVGCEACHGPGSRHVAWARPLVRQGDNGLTVHLTERRGIEWAVDARTRQPARSRPRTTSLEINVCAPCHSRRGQIAEGYTAGAALEDYYVPELLTPGLYYPDGQQRDEVYTYASFLQSRMAAAGVTCADCHEPHSGRVRKPGNQLCTQCHAGSKYDNPAHHFHQPQSAGAQCVSCHMAATVYMGVDARRDHSFRVPRPDRSARMDVPNACTGCHKDRSVSWADDQIRTRTGRIPAGFQSFAEAFDAAEKSQPGAEGALGLVADDRSFPPIVRASALARLAIAPTPRAIDAAVRNLADADATVRRAALTVLEALPPENRAATVTPLLNDPVRSVRLQAAWLLAPAAATLSGTPSGPAFRRAADEFVAARRYRADRAEDRTTLGVFFAQLGRHDEAAAEYRAALRLSPRYTPAYVNLADLQREEGHEEQAEQTLRAGLGVLPKDATLHHALGLSLVRSNRDTEALAELQRAAQLSEDVRFAYTYAVALHGAGKDRDAIAALERARARAPRDHDVLFALATFHRDAGRTADALRYAEELQEAFPEDRDAQALVESLKKTP